MRREFWLVGAIALLVLGMVCLPSCYTVLKHPRQAPMTDEHGGRQSCGDCHDQAFYYHDPFMYRYYDRYDYWDRWYGYYYDPWWYDDYWYYDPRSGAGVVERGERTRFGAEPARPRPPGRGATTGVGSTGGSGTTPTTKPQSDSTGSRDETSSGSEVKKKPTRWGSEPTRPKPSEKSEAPKKDAEKKKADPEKAERQRT